MKKFLTVLLALSVVFTYTVGTAFAAAGDSSATAQQKANLDAAESLALKQVESNFNIVYSEIAGGDVESYTISTTSWDAVKSEILKAVQKEITDATDNAKKTNGWDSDWNSLTGSALANAVYSSTAGYSTAALKNAFASGGSFYTYTVKAAKKQFEADYAAELAKFDKVDMSLYSQTEKDSASDMTYYALAEKYVKDAKDAIKTYIEDEATVYEDSVNTVTGVLAVLNGVKVRTTVGGVGGYPYLKMTKIGTTDIDSGLYQLNPTVFTDLKTIADLENQDTIDAAEAAATKAVIQKNYAAYMTDSTVKNKDVEAAQAYVTVLSWLADQGLINTQTGLSAIKDTASSVLKDFKGAVKDVETLNAFAAKYVAETNAAGSTIRDKETVDKIVKDATTDLYGKAAKVAGYPKKYNSLSDATAAIADAIAENEAYKLDFAKEVKKAALEDTRKAALENYYELEQKAVNAAYDEAIAKVDAAKTATAVSNITVNLSKIKTSAAVDALFAGLGTGSAATGATLYAPAKLQYDVLTKYVDYKNAGLTSRDAAYIDASSLADAMITFYGENGARTKAEIEALANSIQSVVDALPTVGGVASAKTDAEAAITAIPATVTADDEATVEAAWTAANKYAEMLGKNAYTDANVVLTNKAKLTSAINALHSAMALDLAKKSALADKADKSALKAVQAEIDAFNDLCERGSEEIFDGKAAYADTTVQKALDAIRAKELAAVKAAILALPLNISEADEATIENARALYDAFVKEYTDYETPYDAVAAIGYGNLRALTVAETTLAALISDRDIKAVESLKITASSKAVKGKITVKWKVKGDASSIDGYRVYKSTKAQSGYKFMGKTKKVSMVNKKNLKKGTRYFYKVRAYKVVDGKTYYSDYSNKANRYAK